MLHEQIVSPIPPGAGRFLDWYWPDPASMNSGVSQAWKSRAGVVIVAGSSVAGTGAFNLAVINNVGAVLLRTFAAADKAIQVPQQILMFNPRTDASPVSGDDLACIVFRCVMMAGGGLYPADNVHDYGFGWCRSNAVNGMMFTDGADGIAVRVIDAAHIQLGIRGANGLKLFSFAVDTTQFHTYDLVYVAATATGAASFSFLIDGVAQTLTPTSSSWAAGTDLPKNAFTGRVGFTPYIANFLGQIGDNSLVVQQSRIIAAPTFAATQ